jgi:hypothetical protein
MNFFCTDSLQKKLKLIHNQKAEIDRDIFTDWFRDLFIPILRARRERYGLHGPAVLIVDNCSAHRGLEIKHICQERRVVAI